MPLILPKGQCFVGSHRSAPGSSRNTSVSLLDSSCQLGPCLPREACLTVAWGAGGGRESETPRVGPGVLQSGRSAVPQPVPATLPLHGTNSRAPNFSRVKGDWWADAPNASFLKDFLPSPFVVVQRLWESKCHSE